MSHAREHRLTTALTRAHLPHLKEKPEAAPKLLIRVRYTVDGKKGLWDRKRVIVVTPSVCWFGIDSHQTIREFIFRHSGTGCFHPG